MTIEETIASIDASLKTLVTIMQTSADATITFGATLNATTDKPTADKKAKKSDAKCAAPTVPAVLEGDPEGTRYWLIEKHNTVYAQRPGEREPSIEGAALVPPSEYLAKKEEFAKKINAAAEPLQPAAAAPSATATAASVSPNSSTDVEFKTVVERLTVLSKDTRPGKGRDGVMAILNKYLAAMPEAERKVPKLAALNCNAQLLADVDAALSDAPAEFDPFA